MSYVVLMEVREEFSIGLVLRPGFEPGITGLGDQHDMHVSISVDMKELPN